MSTPQEDYVIAASATNDQAVIGNFVLLRHPNLRTNATAESQEVQAAVAAVLEAEKQAQEVTARQAHAALIVMNKDEDAEAAIAAIPDVQQRKLVNNWYERSNVWQYSNPLLTQFAASLGIDKDSFFALAKTL